MPLTVLVVDDNALMRSMLIRTLRLSGLPVTAVHQASSGAEALKQLSTHEVDLAFIDVDLPLVEGAPLAECVRADARLAGVALVVVSPEGSATRHDDHGESGAIFIQRPFTPEQVRATALRVLGVAES